MIPDDIVPESVFAGDDTASAKSITWRFDDPDHVKVQAETDGEATLLVRGTHYEIAGTTLTPLAAIPTGTSWRVYRDTPVGQPSTLSPTAYLVSQYQLGLDRLGMIAQDQQALLDRAVMVPRGADPVSVTPASDLVALWNAAGSVLGSITDEDLAARLVTDLTTLLGSSFKGDPGSAGEGYATKDLLAAAADTASNLDDAYLTTSRQEGKFIMSTSSIATLVEYDWSRNRNVPKASVPAGGSGGFARVNDGTVTIEGGGTGREAVFSALNLLQQDSTLLKLIAQGVHTTVGLGGERVADYSGYANKAAAEVDLATFTDGDLISCTDGTAYLKTTGVLKRVKEATLNGEIIEGLSSKLSGLKLEANRPAGEALFDFDLADVKVVNFHFDGNNPSPEWPGYAGLQNNPLTETLVRVSGYDYNFDHVLTRFSGGDGMEAYGIVGCSGLVNCGWTYNNGVGLKITRNSVTNLVRPWFEGNGVGGCLVAPRVNSGDGSYVTNTAYWLRQGVNSDIAYDENGTATAYTYRIEGAYGCRLGEIVTWANGRTGYDLEFGDAAGNTGLYQSAVGGYMGPTAKIDLKCKFEDRAWNNTVVRLPGLPTNTENGQWRWDDAQEGRTGNTCSWLVSPEAYEPGARHGDLSINAGSSNWATKNGFQANAVRVIGSLHDPLLDYLAAHADGPSVLECTDMDVAHGGGTAFNQTLSLNTALAASTWYWLFYTCEGEAYQRHRLRLWSVAANKYYGWGEDDPTVNDPWAAIGAHDALGYERIIHVQRGQKGYRVPFYSGPGVIAEMRVGLNIVGAGKARLGHCWVDTIDNSALAGIVAGYSHGTPTMRRFTDANRPPATAPFAGIHGHNTTTNTFQLNTGAAYV